MLKQYPKFDTDEEREAFLDAHSDGDGILDLSEYDLFGKPMSEFEQGKHEFEDHVEKARAVSEIQKRRGT